MWTPAVPQSMVEAIDPACVVDCDFLHSHDAVDSSFHGTGSECRKVTGPSVGLRLDNFPFCGSTECEATDKVVNVTSLGEQGDLFVERSRVVEDRMPVPDVVSRDCADGNARE